MRSIAVADILIVGAVGGKLCELSFGSNMLAERPIGYRANTNRAEEADISAASAVR